jgi:outer membrane protein insertion porin family
VAGLGVLGDVDTLKLSATARYYWQLPIERGKPSFGLSFLGGLLRPWAALRPGATGTGTQTLINDRFFLGGPLSVRGFNVYGVGPRDEGDALGGDLSAAVSAELSFDLPSEVLTTYGVRGHVFANAGNVTSLAGVLGICPAPSLQELDLGYRASAGVGIVAPTPFGRLELNFSRPLRHTSKDLPQRFQLGLGVNFL